MSHYANQPGRSPGVAGWLASMPTLVHVATLQTNGTKELLGSVRVHMQSFRTAQNVTLC